MQNYAYLLRLSIKSLLPWKIGARLFRKEGITRICCRNSQFTNMGKYATISKEAETWISAEYKQTQRTREYICWPHYREFPGGNFRFSWLRGKCRCRWKMAWERCSRDEIHIQTATGSPVIAEGYQDNGRLSDHYNSGRSICMESYSIRFLTARQEQTEVVTRAGLVFSI